jgi:hypothetical protein
MQIKKVDTNQREIVTSLRKIAGVSVFSTHAIGKGFADIAVGYKGKNYLFEIKDGERPPSQRKLTPDEIKFFDSWTGQIDVALCLNDILKKIGISE